MYRPELLDYSGILQIHPVAERITSSPNRHGHGHGAGEKDDCVSVSAQPRIVLLTSGNLTDNGSERMLHGNTYIHAVSHIRTVSLYLSRFPSHSSLLSCVYLCMYVCMYLGGREWNWQICSSDSSHPSHRPSLVIQATILHSDDPNRTTIAAAIIFGPAKIWSSLPHPFRRSSPFILSFPARTGPPLVDSATPRRCPCDEASWHVSGSNAMGCNPSSDMEPG